MPTIGKIDAGQLETGDIVYLRSGSPKMTVVEVRPGKKRMVLAAYVAFNTGTPHSVLLPASCFITVVKYIREIV